MSKLYASVVPLLCVLSLPVAYKVFQPANPTQPVAHAEAIDSEDADLAAASWLHAGCIQLGNDCYDVFVDNRGRLWVCDECFTTTNPNPGRCRRLTPSEIANAAWCA